MKTSTSNGYLKIITKSQQMQNSVSTCLPQLQQGSKPLKAFGMCWTDQKHHLKYISCKIINFLVQCDFHS